MTTEGDMNMDKTFYKMRITPDEDGLVVITDKWLSIHETPCFHYCIREHNKGLMKITFNTIKGMPLQTAKKKGIRVKRISKDCSRFAFDTEEKAFEHLRFLKRKQLGHMKRDIKFLKLFLSEATGLDALEKGLYATVPNTKELVHEHYAFD